MTTDADRAARKAARIARMDAPLSAEQLARLRAAESSRLEEATSPEAAAPPAPRGKRGHASRAAGAGRGEMARRGRALTEAGVLSTLSGMAARVLCHAMMHADWTHCRVRLAARMVARHLGEVDHRHTHRALRELVVAGVLVPLDSDERSGRRYEVCLPAVGVATIATVPPSSVAVLATHRCNSGNAPLPIRQRTVATVATRTICSTLSKSGTGDSGGCAAEAAPRLNLHASPGGGAA